MTLATIQDVRDLGNLPDETKLVDGVLSPHLASAERELYKWIGDYSSATGDKRKRCVEAEACLTMSFAIPVLNTFFTEGITTLQKELGEMDFQFHSVDDLDELVEYWRDRARGAVAEWLHQGERKQMGWFAV